MKTIRQRNKLYIALVIGLMQAPLMAQTPQTGALGVCRISPLKQYLQPTDQVIEDGTVYLSGNAADSDERYANVEGDIVAYYGNSRVDASRITLDRTTNVLSGRDQNIRYASDSVVLESKSFTSRLNDKEYEGDDVTYYLHQAEAQGRAKYAISRQIEKTADFQGVTYSTCPTDEEVWQLSAADLHLDENTGRGIAKHAKFSLFGVPILYTPYFSFPIDDRRQTGFLFPTISYDRDGGLAVRAPYYLNLAPNYDVTLNPGFYTRRGLILGAEARYLNTWQNSVFRFDFLPDDRRFKNQERARIAANDPKDPYSKKLHSTRWSVFFNQQLNLMPKLRGRILFQQVSDHRYVEDIQDAVGLLTETNLERVAELTYSDRNWQSTLRVQHYQVLDKVIIPEAPYARMPQWLLSGEWEQNGIIYGANVEAVQFRTHIKPNDRNKARPKSATRLDLLPYVGFRLENSWGFFEPKLAYRYTHYDLDYQDINGVAPNKPHNLHRGTSIFSIDTGIALERDVSFSHLFGGGNFIQTLEPRLFYLNVPYRRQSDIPIFDTGNITPSYDNLFATNQFTGADRQSNANQLTTALTTRFINDETGVEHFRLSLGQIYYFEQPRITMGRDLLPKNECLKGYENNPKQGYAALKCQSGRHSEWFVENHIVFSEDFSTRVIWQWSPDVKRTTRLSYDLRYQPEPRKIINIAQRYDRVIQAGSKDSVTDQIDITSFWEVNNNWAVVGRYNYSLEERRMDDSYVGFEYSDCCVATRVAARYYRTNILDDNQRFKKRWKAYLQFEFKGLGNVGQSTDSFWEESIPGYTPKYLSNTRGF
ncbi:LPS assembly protein LptD [Wohlfahrtiimonas chitiniclastica]|uniref:LPS-assembly protein LptD n=1 Tax=Wohlfahrtiimonas chitiniclastica TaxID=400946 RepID=UPI001BCCE469|nr:LPS assembly protein LptD [Wohlfahrtiimonas chitiniclastica]MBS7817732.1 LPS assembly protein LptD [Wohlfahrtiimonas chitiniclastica]MBS7825699.1 LPS assembly protein LptD [Wohlfahrtiimonas chitiniclastica]